MPSDKNNYIVRIRDPSQFKNCFLFSNPSRFDKSMNRKVTPLLPPLPMLIIRENQRFTGIWGFSPPFIPKKSRRAFCYMTS